MPSARDFRRIVLALEGASEGSHMGHPDFRANGRIFATLQSDMSWGMVKLTPDQQQRFVRDYPEAFKLAAGSWGLGGSTLVHLPSVNEDTLGEAVTLAWQNNAAEAAKKAAPKRKTTVARPATRKATK